MGLLNKKTDDILSAGFSGGGEFRSFNVQLFALLAQVNNYGCWCNFNENWRKGRAEALDEFDAQCRQLNKNYDCIYMDAFEDAGIEDTCIPYNLRYYEPLNLDGDTTDAEIQSACTTDNVGDDCKIRTCIVESTFVRNLSNIGNLYTINTDYQHSNPAFNFNSKCPTPTYGSGEKKCCGNYPHRTPFRDSTGYMECCNNKAYSPMIHNCCSGTVEPFGTC